MPGPSPRLLTPRLLDSSTSQLQVRPVLQEMMRGAVRKMKSRLPGDGSEAVAQLSIACAEEVGAGAQNFQSAGQESVLAWFNKSSATATTTWLSQNDAEDIAQHPAYTAALVKVCRRVNDACHASKESACPPLALGDLIWIVADEIWDNVPACVPGFAAAMTAHVSEQGESAGVGVVDSVPPFARFLCVEHERDAPCPKLCMLASSACGCGSYLSYPVVISVVCCLPSVTHSIPIPASSLRAACVAMHQRGAVRLSCW